MKRIPLLCLVLLCCLFVSAQDKSPDDFTGVYQIEYYPARKFIIKREDKNLTLEIVGQGKTELVPAGGNNFSLKGVPNAIVEFSQDSQKNTNKFLLRWPAHKLEWDKISGDSSISKEDPENLHAYEGRYKLKQNEYLKTDIKSEAGHLTSQIPGETVLKYIPSGPNKFIFKYGGFSSELEFKKDKKVV
jgi:hypothetical protein